MKLTGRLTSQPFDNEDRFEWYKPNLDYTYDSKSSYKKILPFTSYFYLATFPSKPQWKYVADNTSVIGASLHFSFPKLEISLF